MDNTLIWFGIHRQGVPFVSHPPYLPIHAGKAIASFEIPGTIGDDTGDNISARNPLYGEATAHYWAWKNMPAAIRYAGHGQYRRYFDFELPPKRFNIAAQTYFAQEHALPDFDRLFERYDIVLPPVSRLDHTPYKQYCDSHIEEHLFITRQVIREKHPDYLRTFDRYFFHGNRVRYDYLFIAPRRIVDDFSAWLFDILMEVERRIDPDSLRALNYIGERLIEVYVRHNRLRVKEAALVLIGQPPIETSMSPLKRLRKHLSHTLLSKKLIFLLHQPVRLRRQKRAIEAFEMSRGGAE